MADYSYKQEEGKFVLHENDKPLTNPDDVVIATTNEELAKVLISELKADKGYTSPASLLTYHYTYCNLEQRDFNELVDQFCQSANYDVLMGDEYLMFHQDSPIRQAIASYVETDYPELFKSFNLYQLTAIMVVFFAYHSLMLSYYIIADICIPLSEDKDADYESLKEGFMEDLEEFERGEGIDETYRNYSQHVKNISAMIDAFVYYFAL
jgi:hypothetical protein